MSTIRSIFALTLISLVLVSIGARSPAPAPAPVSSPPLLYPQCCVNPGNPDCCNLNSGEGHEEQLGGLNSYLSGSPHSKLAIILASDVYGFKAPILRKIADKVAAAGFLAIVPDFFFGDPFVPDIPERPNAVWLKDHPTDKGFKDTIPVIEALTSRGVKSIGAAGICWGGKVMVQLAQSDLIRAAVLLHPSYITVDDIKGVKVPIDILYEKSKSDLAKQLEEALNNKPEVRSRVKIFTEANHGWTVRYDVKNQTSVKLAEKAHADMLHWFTKYVK